MNLAGLGGSVKKLYKKYPLSTIIAGVMLLLMLVSLFDTLLILIGAKKDYDYLSQAPGVTFGKDSRDNTINNYYVNGKYGPQDKYYWYKVNADKYGVPVYMVLGHHVIENPATFFMDWIEKARQNKGSLAAYTSISNQGALGPMQFLPGTWSSGVKLVTNVVGKGLTGYWVPDMVGVRNPLVYMTSMYWDDLTLVSKIGKGKGSDFDGDGRADPFNIYESIGASAKYDADNQNSISRGAWPLVFNTKFKKDIATASLYFNGSFRNPRVVLGINEYINFLKKKYNISNDDELYNIYVKQARADGITTEAQANQWISRKKVEIAKEVESLGYSEGVAYGFKVILLGKVIEDVLLQNLKSTPEYSNNSSFIFPIRTESGLYPRSYLTSPFGMRMHPVYHSYKFHAGIDFGFLGTNSDMRIIQAVKDGVVIFSDWINGGGNTVAVDHGDHITVYMHLDSRTVQAGTTIKQGQQVGIGGNTGVGTGPHLHFEVRQIKGQRPYNLTVPQSATSGATRNFLFAKGATSNYSEAPAVDPYEFLKHLLK